MVKLIRIDFDNIGDKIDFFLLNNKFEKAQEISNVIKLSIKEALLYINQNFNSPEILLIGADDILFSANDPEKKQIELFKDFFYEKTDLTVSIGVGNNIRETLLNLKEAKVSGRNIIKGI